MTSADKGVVPCLGPSFSKVMGVARLSRPSDDGADPFVSLVTQVIDLSEGSVNSSGSCRP
jgi:hypothetical protein